MRGGDAKVSPNDDRMVWLDANDGEDIREEDCCTILARHLSSFMAGREHLFPLPCQAITRLLCDYIPYGDKKGQYDHADLPFDDAQVPSLRVDFETQDKALYRLWEKNGIPEYLKSMVLGGIIKHNMGTEPGEVYNVTALSACSFIRAILLVRKPLTTEHKRLLDNDMKGISSSFKKGSPLLAVQASLIKISRNKTYQLPVTIKDILKNTVETRFVRFPQEFGQVRQDFGDTMNDQWNSRVDITDVLSQFLNITIHPIAKKLKRSEPSLATSAQTKCGQPHRLKTCRRLG